MKRRLHSLRNAALPLAARLAGRPASGNPRRLLLLQPDHIGDVLLSQPAVAYLREQRPDYELIAVVGPWSEEIARLSWPVDHVETVQFPGFTRAAEARPWTPYSRLAHESARLRQLGAGSALILRPDAWWAAWLARLSVSGAVYGFDNPLTRPFLTHTTTPDRNHRSIVAMSVVSAALGRDERECSFWDMSPSIAVPETVMRRARDLLERFRVRAPYVVFHPGAGAQVKLWPTARWRALAAGWAGSPQVVITGNRDERRLCASVAAASDRAVSIAGETDLGTLAGVLRGAEVAVGTDNGAMHVAGAVRTPTVRLFGPSDAGIYGPLPDSPRHRVVSAGWRCPRCGDLGPDRKQGCGCMLAITVEQVRAAIDQVLRTDDAA